MLIMLGAAILPLLFGASIGPEAGLTGIIVGLCYWVGDNTIFAGKNAKEYSEIGIAATLSVLFYAPLFGIFAGVCLGYGISLMIFPGDAAHAVFAAAIVTASMLGSTMKKPVAVAMLMLLCFPVKMLVWIFLATVIGAKLPSKNK